jgi:hypothetical protein
MRASRINKNKPGRKKRSRNRNTFQRDSALQYAVELVNVVCCLAGDDRLLGDRTTEETNRLRRAIENHDTPCLFDFLMGAFSLQGISDHAAYVYMERHGRVAWQDLERATRQPLCPKLRCYWTFSGCGYQKDARTCAEPKILPVCPLPKLDLRNGRLNQIAYSLFFFIRDVADGDLVDWIDRQLEEADTVNNTTRIARMRNALLAALRNLFGVSDKVLNMSLADLLSSAPPSNPRWLEPGVNMNAIDRLVHAFMHRTGILRRFRAQHSYGPACYGANGCAEIISQIAKRIDARKFNPDYPRFYPRMVQHAVWRYCAQLELNVCNGVQIDDRYRCGNQRCPLYQRCDRVPLHPKRPRLADGIWLQTPDV